MDLTLTQNMLKIVLDYYSQSKENTQLLMNIRLLKARTGYEKSSSKSKEEELTDMLELSLIVALCFLVLLTCWCCYGRAEPEDS